MPPSLGVGFFRLPGWLSGLGGAGTAIGWCLLVIFALFWLAMLVDCLRRPAFYPIFRLHWQTRVFWLLTFLLFNPLMTVMYLAFGSIARPRERASSTARYAIVAVVVAIAILSLLPSTWGPTRAMRFARNAATGQMEAENGQALSPPSLSAEAYESSNSMTSTTSTGGSADSALPCEHLLILNNSAHPLMQRVGVVLAEQLSALSSIQTVDLLPPGEILPPSQRAPEMIVVLDAPKIEETDLPGYKELKAVVEASAGQIPWSSGTIRFESSQPPTLHVALHMNLDHSSRTVGIEAGGARYKKDAEDIAKQFGKHLTETFDKWHREHGVMPDLPSSFYGPYVPAPDLPFGSMPNCKQIVSGYGLFEHNRTVWQIDDPRDTADVMNELHADLEARDWKADRSTDSAEASKRLSVRRGEKRLEAFVPQRTSLSFTSSSSASLSPIIAIYHDPFSPEERCRAIDELLTSNAPVETVMRFRNSTDGCKDDLRDRIYQRAEQGPVASVRAVVDLAEWQHSHDRKDQARATLRRAAALAKIVSHQDDAKKSIEDAAKKLGDPHLAKAKPSEEDLRQLGLPQVSPDGTQVTKEVGIGEPVLCYARPEPEVLLGVEVRVLPGDKPDEPFKLSLSASHEGDRVTTTVGLSATKNGPIRGSNSVGFENCRFQAEAVSADRRRFVVTVKMLSFDRDQPPATAPSRPPG